MMLQSSGAPTERSYNARALALAWSAAPALAMLLLCHRRQPNEEAQPSITRVSREALPAHNRPRGTEHRTLATLRLRHWHTGIGQKGAPSAVRPRRRKGVVLHVVAIYPPWLNHHDHRALGRVADHYY